MIIAGIVCLILGLLLPLGVVSTLLVYGGIALIVIGLVLLLLGAAGRPVGGRNNWW